MALGCCSGLWLNLRPLRSRARSNYTTVVARAPTPTVDTYPSTSYALHDGCVLVSTEVITVDILLHAIRMSALLRRSMTFVNLSHMQMLPPKVVWIFLLLQFHVSAEAACSDSLPNGRGTPTPVFADGQTTRSHSLSGSAGEILAELSSSQLAYRLEDPAEANQPDTPPGNEDIRPQSPSGCCITDSSFSDDTQGSLLGCTDPPQGDVSIPVPASTGEISSKSPPSRPLIRLNPVKAKEHVDRIHRFRILVMGRANAGKTTILQRVCNTTDQPEIFNGEGQKVDPTVVQGSSKRGYHNIEDELVFQNNPCYVFHDSRGFEAGSEEQFDMMRKFVMDRASTPKLDKRIHAIWFCIALTDIHRMVTAAEKKFFQECDTGCVPVIVLLTKADSLELEAIEQLEDQGLTVDATSIAALEKKILDDNIAKLKNWLNEFKFAPHDYLALSGMHEEGGECTSLLTCTANALTGEGLQELLVSTQQTNLGLCIEFAILKTLKVYMKRRKIDPRKLEFKLSKWFPYKKELKEWEKLRKGPLEEKGFLFEEPFELPIEPPSEVDHDLVPSIHHHDAMPRMPFLATTPQSSMKHIVEHAIGTLLVFEYLYFLLQADTGRTLEQDFTFALQEYQTSDVKPNVHQLIEAAFMEHGEDIGILCPILVDIAKENQMSKRGKMVVDNLVIQVVD